MTTFTLRTDPGHGWLEVPFGELRALSLNPTDFSRYSYRNGNTFYLEEDCDASKFAEVWEAKHGRKIAFVTTHDGAFIRNLPSIY